MNDGSSQSNLQILAQPDALPEGSPMTPSSTPEWLILPHRITTGCSVVVSGQLQESPKGG